MRLPGKGLQNLVWWLLNVEIPSRFLEQFNYSKILPWQNYTLQVWDWNLRWHQVNDLHEWKDSIHLASNGSIIPRESSIPSVGKSSICCCPVSMRNLRRIRCINAVLSCTPHIEHNAFYITNVFLHTIISPHGICINIRCITSNWTVSLPMLFTPQAQ